MWGEYTTRVCVLDGIGNKQETTRNKNSHPGTRNTAQTAALYTIETTPELTHSQDHLKVCLHTCTSTTQPDVGVTYRGHTAVRPGWPPRRGRGRETVRVRVSVTAGVLSYKTAQTPGSEMRAGPGEVTCNWRCTVSLWSCSPEGGK